MPTQNTASQTEFPSSPEKRRSRGVTDREKRVSFIHVEQFLVEIESKPLMEQRKLIADKIDLIETSLAALNHEMYEVKKSGQRDRDWEMRAVKARSVKLMQLHRLRSVLDNRAALQAHRTFAERFVVVARKHLDSATVQAIADQAEAMKGASQ